MAEPLHSFAVLAHGESPYLAECLESLQAQTLPSQIYIATSTPSSRLAAVAQRYGMVLLCNDGQGGLASDWTFAYRSCRTPYLTLAHQDDRYMPGYTAACLAAARPYPGAQIVFTDYRETWDGGNGGDTLNVQCKRLIARGAFGRSDALATVRAKRRLLRLGCVIPCPTVMFHVAAIGPFAFAKPYQVNVDWDAWLRLAEQQGEFIYVRETLLEHRLHAGAATSRSISAGQRQREDRMMLARLWPRWLAPIAAAVYGISLRTKRWRVPPWRRNG